MVLELKKKKRKTRILKRNKHRRALIIFIRVPELGKVKTRLAEEVGDEKALDIYKALLTHTRSVAEMVNATPYLYYASDPVDDEWSSTVFHKKIQNGNGLGERMKNAFQSVLTTYDSAIIIGSDCPQLSIEIVDNAFMHLEENDAVLGPTYDGGYYLLGMKNEYSFLFENIEWSTDSVFSQTTQRLAEHHLSYEVLPTLSDVDHKSDWDAYGWEI